MLTPKYPHHPIASIASLCKALDISSTDLNSLAESSNSQFFISKEEKKRNGSIRTTYNVKAPLKSIHHRINAVFLKKVIYPSFLHGGLKKKDYLSNTRDHLNKKLIISEDASNFFPSLSVKVVHQIWVGVFGFSNDVAAVLAELVTFNGYLVQGGKTSSFLANLALFDREAQLVSDLQKKGMIYTRYIDDITVSCDRYVSKAEQSHVTKAIYALLKTINVRPNREKHQIMSSGGHLSVHRVNLNSGKPTLPKKVRHNIKSAVHECEVLYEESYKLENYKSLYNKTIGRVHHMSRLHPESGKKLLTRLMLVKPENGRD